MIIRVKTDNAGSASDTFVLPLNSGFTYNFDVDWGDGGAVETITNASLGFPSISHTYASAGEYDISISENVAGGFPSIYFANGGDKLKLLQLKQWGTSRWESFGSSFRGCSNLVITATDEATANTGNVTDFTYAWDGCTSLASFPLIDTSGGIDFSYTWQYCSGLTSFPLIDTSNATTFYFTWRNCTGLTSFPLLNTSQVTSFKRAWRSCTGLTSFPLLDLSAASDFESTWRDCTSLSSFPAVDLSNMTDGSLAFMGVTLSTSSYTNLLISIAALNPNLGVTFNGGSSTYYPSAAAARATLVGNGWTITDGGETPLPPAPVTDFSADVTSGTAPLTVQFTDASTNTPTSWDWDFGDGTAHGTTQNPSHVYSTAGTYTVILIATNAGGSDSETKTDYITVTVAISFSSPYESGRQCPMFVFANNTSISNSGPNNLVSIPISTIETPPNKFNSDFPLTIRLFFKDIHADLIDGLMENSGFIVQVTGPFETYKCHRRNIKDFAATINTIPNWGTLSTMSITVSIIPIPPFTTISMSCTAGFAMDVMDTRAEGAV